MAHPPPLAEVRIRDVRSIWGPPLHVRLGEHVTVLVGPNRSGTSNVAWAIAAALDPGRRFRPGRDLPRHVGGTPEVDLVDADGHHTTVRFDPDGGGREVDGPPRGGPVVLSRIHETPRDVVRRVPGGFADAAARADLAADLTATLRRVLPEIEHVEVDGRLVVRVRDDLGSLLPVPETRALVALGVARHLVARGTPPAATVLEAPGAFLHPAAQQTVSALLVEVGRETGAPVVVTTSSPFTIPRVPSVRVVALARDAAGRTGLVGDAAGDETQARLLGGLLRDAGLAAVLDRIGQLPEGTRAVLIVEGGTDVAYLRLAARLLDREHLLDHVVLSPSGGAMPAAMSAIVLRAETDVPLLVLLDHDQAGKRARDTLKRRFGFRREVLSYAEVLPGHPEGVEAETLFEPRLVRRFVAERGAAAVHGERDLDGHPHLDLTSAAKAAFVTWLDEHATPDQLGGWSALLDLVADRLPPAP